MRSRRFIWILALAATLVAGCCIEPPLHLRKVVATKVDVIAKMNVDMMWQLNWSASWDFNWNVTMLGPVEYTVPSRMSLHVYTQGPDKEHVAHTLYNFVGDNTEMDVFVGTHDLLFYNDDCEAIHFKSDGELEPIHAYTEARAKGLRESSPVYTTSQKSAGITKADEPDDEPINEPVVWEPENLFSQFDANTVITDNPSDYVYENGKYILKIEGQMEPSTFIFLTQIRLLNNKGRVTGSAAGAAITGMAGGVNLFTRETWTGTVSVPMDVYMDNTQDMLGARVCSFGIPGCNPYDDASVASAPEGKHYLVLNLSYYNNTYKNIRINITDLVRALPLGGVIDLELDVDDFPPESGESGGGGFSALIGDWDEETGSTTIIN